LVARIYPHGPTWLICQQCPQYTLGFTDLTAPASQPNIQNPDALERTHMAVDLMDAQLYVNVKVNQGRHS
jgi:hypothetical protein